MASLTTIRQPIHDIACAAADLLSDGEARTADPHRILHYELVVRRSTGPAPR